MGPIKVTSKDKMEVTLAAYLPLQCHFLEFAYFYACVKFRITCKPRDHHQRIAFTGARIQRESGSHMMQKLGCP